MTSDRFFLVNTSGIYELTRYRRKNSPHLWCEFVLAGRRFQLSTGTANRDQANEFETLARARAYNQLRLGHRPAVPWQVVADRWLTESRKRSLDKDRAIIAWFTSQFEPTTTVQSITSDVIKELRALKAEETSEATADRYMALLNSILRKCVHEWEILDAAPKVPMYRPERRNRAGSRGSSFAGWSSSCRHT